MICCYPQAFTIADLKNQVAVIQAEVPTSRLWLNKLFLMLTYLKPREEGWLLSPKCVL